MLKTAADQYQDVLNGKFREARQYQVAPISTNFGLSYVAEQLLGIPRSF